MPLTDHKKKNFDIDLEFGGANEEVVRSIFEDDGSIEVKTERDKWLETGNIAIELKHKGKPSGISTTNAKWWIHVLTSDGNMKFSFIFPVSVLKRKVKHIILEGKGRITMGGDDNLSTLALIPIKEVIKNEL